MKILAVILAALALAGAAQAANAPSPALDAAATAIAGQPVTVWCETDWTAWYGMAAQAGQAESSTEAFTYFADPVVYVSPSICAALHGLLDHTRVPPFTAADALLALAHEAVHQSGVVDEGVTDCTALGLVPATAIRLGVPAKVTTTTTKIVRKKLHGRWVKRRVKIKHTAANPLLAALTYDARYWHEHKPATYQGTC